jgi:hypothetical protein
MWLLQWTTGKRIKIGGDWFGWWRYLDFNDGGFEMLQLKKA